jgi:tRNA 2-thiouridine synthesizing protein E
MLDINHIINEKAHDRIDPEGHMYELEHWSPLTATQMAREEGIGELTEAHWHVIYALRNLYRESGRSANARKVMHMLELDFADEGGRRYLYELFPKGPVSQGSRLAGVPVPPYASDPSFGWAG